MDKKAYSSKYLQAHLCLIDSRDSTSTGAHLMETFQLLNNPHLTDFLKPQVLD